MDYEVRRHAARRSDDFVFRQLLPYIGSKRKLLPLIGAALLPIPRAERRRFVDYFAGSGVVSRWAKTLGFRVVANDWEPYSQCVTAAALLPEREPAFPAFGGYAAALAALNALEGREDWVSRHLCPRDDGAPDPSRERMFFMRKNGLRIDAIRDAIAEWRAAGRIDRVEELCLLAPLLYQVSYTANTSGVFKGFHAGWGGRTGTALHRIASDLRLLPLCFHANGQENEVHGEDAEALAERLPDEEGTVAYLDPPYNQHPYGSNYHVLNSVTLWDRPELPAEITPGTKAAIRRDWREARRSAFNHRAQAAGAYARLLSRIRARLILTSYSSEGQIALEDLLRINCERGAVSLTMRRYKRYRVSRQRPSPRPSNVEFVLAVDTSRREGPGVDELMGRIRALEREGEEA